jgi:hypothetical protein
MVLIYFSKRFHCTGLVGQLVISIITNLILVDSVTPVDGEKKINAINLNEIRLSNFYLTKIEHYIKHLNFFI